MGGRIRRTRRHPAWRPDRPALEARMMLAASVTDLGLLPGDNQVAVTGLNDAGQVVGY